MGKTFIKLTLAFLIILSSLAFVLWFTHGKMSILREELNSRKNYDNEIVLINKLFVNIENFYLVSNQKDDNNQSIDQTQQKLEPVNSRIINTIQELKNSTINKSHKTVVDSINALYIELAENTIELIVLQKMASTAFDKPLLTILNETTQTLRDDTNFVKKKELISSKELKKIEQEKAKKARIAKRKQKKDPNYIIPEQDDVFTADSSLYVKLDGAFSHLSKAIIKEQSVINRRKQELDIKIYEIEINKHYIYQRINNLLSQLRNEEQFQLNIRINNASQYAEDALYWLFVILISAFVLAIMFFMLIIYDISKANYFKNRLIKEKNKAEKLAKDKESFLNNISHEIRTPLNAIIGFSKLLAERQHDSKCIEYAQQIQSSSDHLLNLVNETLDYTRVENGLAQPKEEEFDSVKTLHGVISELEILAQKKNLEIKTNFTKAQNTVIGDITWFKQIIYNIVGNSIKYTNNGHVTIETTWQITDLSKKITIKVTDTGIGMPEEQIKSIFDAYKKDFRPSISSGSTGLGLPITKKIIELQNGTIQVSSKLGVGSVFIIEIPFKIGQALDLYYNKQKEELSKVKSPDLKDKSILIIDDDLPSLMLLEIVLNQWKATVTKAQNVKEAINILDSQKFDYIITDWNLGDQKAELILQHIAQTEIKTPVIIASADNNIKEYVLAYKSIEIKITPKPISASELTNILT